jgi:hypothetical protein
MKKTKVQHHQRFAEESDSAQNKRRKRTDLVNRKNRMQRPLIPQKPQCLPQKPPPVPKSPARKRGTNESLAPNPAHLNLSPQTVGGSSTRKEVLTLLLPAGRVQKRDTDFLCFPHI